MGRPYDRRSFAESLRAGHQIPVDTGEKLLLVVGSDEDTADIATALPNMRVNVRVEHIGYMLDNFKMPPAKADYAADVECRVRVALDRWGKLDKSTQLAELRFRQICPSSVFVLARQTGFAFSERDLMREPEFAEVLDQHSRLKENLTNNDFPGCHAERVIEVCGGSRNFFKIVSTICQRREDADRVTRDSVTHQSYVAMAPLGGKDQPISIYNIHEVGTWVRNPRPKQANGSTKVPASHYFVPDLNSSAQTEAQRPRIETDFPGSDGQALLRALRRVGIRPGKRAAAPGSSVLDVPRVGGQVALVRLLA